MAEPTSIRASKGGLFLSVSSRMTLGAVAIGALLFGPAGSFNYWNGWLFMAALFIPMTFALIYLYGKDRSLLEKRMRTDEKERAQKAYVKLSLLWCVIFFALPGFDHRFGWSHVPAWLVVVSVAVMDFGYVLFIVAMVQNRFASRVIEIQTDQRVIDTGLYSVVRHPMYMAASIMFMPCPLVLGSYYGLIPAVLLPVLLVYRILNEEKVLNASLAGYNEYTCRVRFRLIPSVW